VAYQLAIPTDL